MKLPRGITKTPKGWRIYVSRGPGRPPFTKRFKPSTPFEDVKSERDKALSRQTAGVHIDTQSFAADVARYLRDYFAGRSAEAKAERQRHLALWRTALAQAPRGDTVLGAGFVRSSVTRDDISRVLQQWRITLGADTCNKRRTALLALYHALDGKGGSNPVREIPKFRAPDPLPRGRSYQDIEKAFDRLPRCKTKARLQVLAYTGMRPGQLMALQPCDWDHRDHVVTVPSSGKGRGTKPYTIPLMGRAREALTLFDTLDAWGRFTWAPMNRMWQAAWRAAKLAEPAPVVYDLRHSFGTAIWRATGDIQAAKKLLGHSSIRMTERYTLAGVPDQQLAAVIAFQRRLPRRKKSA